MRDLQELMTEAGSPGVMSLSPSVLQENLGCGQEKGHTPGPFRGRGGKERWTHWALGPVILLGVPAASPTPPAMTGD